MLRIIAVIKHGYKTVGYRLLEESDGAFGDYTIGEALQLLSGSFSHGKIADGRIILYDGDIDRLPFIDAGTLDVIANDCVIILDEYRPSSKDIPVSYLVTDFSGETMELFVNQLLGYKDFGFYNARIVNRKGRQTLYWVNNKNMEKKKKVLDGEQYLRKETLLSTEYVRDWGMFEAAKELCQNHIFAIRHYGANSSIKYDYNKGRGIWEDDGPGFDLEMLLIGKGVQKDIENMPGENSEGMKLSMLVALRENRAIQIEIPHYTITGKIEKGAFGSDELVLYIYTNNRVRGTKFSLEVDKETFKEANDQFGVIKNPQNADLFSKDSILFTSGKQELYINGVKIRGNRNMLFSYNLVGKNLSNRDRNAVNNYDIANHIWATLLGRLENLKEEDQDRVVKRIFKNIGGNFLEFETIPTWDITSNTIEIFKNAIVKNYNRDISMVCYATGSDADQRAKYKGFALIPTPCIGVARLLRKLGVERSDQIAPPKNKIYRDVVKLKDLDPDERHNFSLARRLIRKVYCPGLWDTKIVNCLRDSFGQEVIGLCDYDNEVIFIDRELLYNFGLVFKTCIHEAVHQVSKEDDLSEGFEREFAVACLAFAEKLANL